METLDEFPVGIITGLCDMHAEQFASLAVLVIEAPSDDYPGGCSDRVDHLRNYLAEQRSICEEGCGRKGIEEW